MAISYLEIYDNKQPKRYENLPHIEDNPLPNPYLHNKIPLFGDIYFQQTPPSDFYIHLINLR